MAYSVNVFSQASIGKILFTVGQVTAKHGSQERRLARGALFYVGDSIITGYNARAQIKYDNGALVSIEPNSHYQTLSYEPKDNLVIKSSLIRGEINYDSNNKAYKHNIITTPLVALAILGTQLQLRVNHDSSYVKVTKGTVCVENLVKKKIQKPCLGPKQPALSGTFYRNGRFTSDTRGFNDITNDAVVEINETVAVVTTTNSVIQQLSEIADILIVGIS